MFDYALEKSEHDKLTLVAHSQGTAATFYGMAKNGQYWKSKLNMFVGLNPVARLTHSKSELV